MSWQVIYTKQALKDARNVKAAGLQKKATQLLKILQEDPFQNLPSYGKLIGDLAGFYSRRLNQQHRLVYSVKQDERIVKILRMWTHYE